VRVVTDETLSPNVVGACLFVISLIHQLLEVVVARSRRPRFLLPQYICSTPRRESSGIHSLSKSSLEESPLPDGQPECMCTSASAGSTLSIASSSFHPICLDSASRVSSFIAMRTVRRRVKWVRHPNLQIIVMRSRRVGVSRSRDSRRCVPESASASTKYLTSPAFVSTRSEEVVDTRTG
jgi:hypothetical protein